MKHKITTILGKGKDLNNIVVPCFLNRLNLAVYLQFFIDIFNMLPHGTGRKEKVVGNYGITKTFAQLFQNLNFTCRKGDFFFVTRVLNIDWISQ